MNDKEVMKKLFKIAENQQKIINKLAQNLSGDYVPAQLGGVSGGWNDVSHAVAQKLSTIPAAKHYRLDNAQVAGSNNSLKGTLVYPKNDQNYYDVLKALKSALVGQSLKTNDGKEVQVAADPQLVSFTGMTA